jgi:hypothetical protein
VNDDDRKLRNSSRLQECFSTFRSRISAVIADLEAQGWRPRIQDAWRSPEDQLKAFRNGNSTLKFGFHNATGKNGEKESLAVDLLDDDAPLSPSTKYLLSLAAVAQAHGLATGIRWGLPDELRAAIDAAILSNNFDNSVKVGWDPTHVECTGITPSQAEAGKRPD